MSSKNREIYILSSHTGTVLSKLVKVFTRAEFSHVSISLDKELNGMYSFGRLNPYNPFIGGFVHEGINIGTFNRFQKTKAEIFSIKVTEVQYNKIKEEIKNFETNKLLYKFNIIGLILAGIDLKYKRENHFYCAEFVKYLFDVAGIDMNLSTPVKPMYFKVEEQVELLYNGLLKNYI